MGKKRALCDVKGIVVKRYRRKRTGKVKRKGKGLVEAEGGGARLAPVASLFPLATGAVDMT